MSLVSRVLAVDLRSPGVAEAIHRVQMAAYAQEAELLGAGDFPPLRRSVADLRDSREAVFVAMVGEEVVGAIGIEPDGDGYTIASLVVAPAYQRRGVGKALVGEILRRFGAGSLTVQTGAANLPALSLYSRSGFEEVRRWQIEPESLELVALRRRPGNAEMAQQCAVGPT